MASPIPPASFRRGEDGTARIFRWIDDMNGGCLKSRREARLFGPLQKSLIQLLFRLPPLCEVGSLERPSEDRRIRGLLCVVSCLQKSLTMPRSGVLIILPAEVRNLRTLQSLLRICNLSPNANHLGIFFGKGWNGLGQLSAEIGQLQLIRAMSGSSCTLGTVSASALCATLSFASCCMRSALCVSQFRLE